MQPAKATLYLQPKRWVGMTLAAVGLLASFRGSADTPTNAAGDVAVPTVAVAPVAASPAAAEPAPSPAPTPIAPKVLKLEMTVLRFKPTTNAPFYEDYNLSGPISSVTGELLAAGGLVDVLYHGVRELILEPKSSAKFSATETRPVVLIGKQGTSPPAIVYGLTMDVAARPMARDAFALSWDGVLNWSPDLIDRRAAVLDPSKLLQKAATAASEMGSLAGKSQAASIGLAVADLFKEDPANNSAIYELPVLKTVALGGSRVCHSGDTVINSTSAEAGGNETQIIFFIINPVLE